MIPRFDTRDFDKHYCALITPFKPSSLEVDYDAFRKLVRYLVTSDRFLKANGALIANPEAAEIFYLTIKERELLIKIVMEERPRGMPVFGGCYGVSRDEIITSALHAKSLGVDGIFVMPPSGTMEVSQDIDCSGNPEIWTDHTAAIAEATQLPLIIHAANHWTFQWGFGVPIETAKMMLEQVPSIVGWKMIYGNVAAHFRVAKYIRTLSRHVAILNAPYFAHHTALLCDLYDGGVQGTYNFLLESLMDHHLVWEAGDMDGVKRIWNGQVMPVLEFINADHSRLHIRYKLATWIRGFIAHPFMRPPMPAPRWEEADRIHQIIGKTGLSCIGRAELESAFVRKDAILGRK